MKKIPNFPNTNILHQHPMFLGHLLNRDILFASKYYESAIVSVLIILRRNLGDKKVSLSDCQYTQINFLTRIFRVIGEIQINSLKDKKMKEKKNLYLIPPTFPIIFSFFTGGTLSFPSLQKVQGEPALLLRSRYPLYPFLGLPGAQSYRANLSEEWPSTPSCLWGMVAVFPLVFQLEVKTVEMT